MLSVSPITTLPGAAPISAATRSPTRVGACIHPALFQPRISRSPHSSAMTACARACAAIGNGPSELPSRYVTPAGRWNRRRVAVKSVIAA
jgi:hypothetical protein